MTSEPDPARVAHPWSELTARFLLLLTASYGLLYFSYKFLIPWSGTNDFQHYYWMDRSPLNFHVAPSPFVLRQVSAVLTWLVWRAHIYYPNDIWFTDPRYDQHVFFAALFTNWICLVLAALTAGLITEEMLGRRSFLGATLAGLICILSFHTQFVVISGDTEGVSWLMMSLAFLAYRRRAEWAVAILLALAVLQREALIVAVACIVALELFRAGRPLATRSVRILLYAAVCFAVYLVLRRLVPGNSHQVQLSGILDNLITVHFRRAIFFQSFLNQNVILIALGAALASGRGVPLVCRITRHRWLPVLLATWACLAFLALCAGLDVDIGRIAAITVPLFAACAAADLIRIDAHEAPGELAV